MKLDYSLETAEERNELVKKIIADTPPEKLTPKYLDILAKYIVEDKKETKKKELMTSNRMVTINARETSFEGLISKFEKNGEDCIYNLIANDKNIIFKPSYKITQKDVEDIPALKDLRDAINAVSESVKHSTGRRKYLLTKQLIEMRKNQYEIKNSYRKPIYFTNTIKSFPKITFDEKTTLDEHGLPTAAGLSFFNPEHVSTLLCNYSKLKEDSWDKFTSDAYYIMKDLDNLIESVLKINYPIYYDLLIYKIDGMSNVDIQSALKQKHNKTYSVEYISALWRNKIPKLLAQKAQDQYLEWYYTYKERGNWKRCSKCGQIKLAHPRFFSKNNTSKDGYYSICKSCRNKKKK